MREQRKAELLNKVELFSSLTPEELGPVAAVTIVKNFKKNETVLHEEQTSEFMYIILDGEVKVSRSTGEGKEITLAMHRSGEFFGEMSLLDGKTVPARVSASCGSTVAVISKNDFYSVLFGQRKVAEKLMTLLCARVRESWSNMQMLTFKSASQRVKTLLVMVSEKHGEKVDGWVRLNIKLTHQNIAEMTAMSRETVTRVMDRWQKDGEVTVKDRSICLKESFCKEFKHRF